MKRCYVCKENKAKSAFGNDKSTCDGVYYCCRLCKSSKNEADRKRRFSEDPWLYLLKQKAATAKHDGTEFTLTEEWLRENISEACPYMGVPFRFIEPGTSGSGWGKLNPSAPTFDRIDSDLGYTPENTEIVSWAYNNFKKELHPEMLEFFCRSVIEKIDSKNEDALHIREARGL